jgi:hypothetical protein
MSEGEKHYTGGCLCGAWRYEVVGEPLYTGHCYCSDCQKASASGFIPFMGFPRSPVRFSDETASSEPKPRVAAWRCAISVPVAAAWCSAANSERPTRSRSKRARSTIRRRSTRRSRSLRAAVPTGDDSRRPSGMRRDAASGSFSAQVILPGLLRLAVGPSGPSYRCREDERRAPICSGSSAGLSARRFAYPAGEKSRRRSYSRLVNR